MSQNNEKNHKAPQKKPIFLRGLLPSTQEWIDRQIDKDAPSRPKVVKRILEEQQRQQTGKKK